MECTDWLDAGSDAAQARPVMVTAITHHEFGSCLREDKQVVLVFAVRELADPLPALAGLPELVISGLDEGAAQAWL
jgi:hypothetical protein